MFPRASRLSRAVLEGGKAGLRRHSPNLTALMPAQGTGYAVVISKKTLRRSVDRHLAKRRILGALRRAPALPLPASLILYPKASVLTLSPEELRAELVTLLSK